MLEKINSEMTATIEKFAEVISIFLRSLENLQQRVDTLNNLSVKPTTQILKLIKEKALSNEDFETCEALKTYAESRNIEL